MLIGSEQQPHRFLVPPYTEILKMSQLCVFATLLLTQWHTVEPVHLPDYKNKRNLTTIWYKLHRKKTTDWILRQDHIAQGYLHSSGFYLWHRNIRSVEKTLQLNDVYMLNECTQAWMNKFATMSRSNSSENNWKSSKRSDIHCATIACNTNESMLFFFLLLKCFSTDSSRWPKLYIPHVRVWQMEPTTQFHDTPLSNWTVFFFLTFCFFIGSRIRIEFSHFDRYIWLSQRILM